MARNMVLTYLHFLDPEDLPLISFGEGEVEVEYETGLVMISGYPG